MQQSCS
jgi:hypothetical protein